MTTARSAMQLEGRPLHYRLQIDRPQERMNDLVLSNAVAQIIEGAADNPPREQPHVTFECDGETCVLIL
jgi:hypothetical protein